MSRASPPNCRPGERRAVERWPGSGVTQDQGLPGQSYCSLVRTRSCSPPRVLPASPSQSYNPRADFPVRQVAAPGEVSRASPGGSQGFGLAGAASPESLAPSRCNAPAAPDGAAAWAAPAESRGPRSAPKANALGPDTAPPAPALGITPALELGVGGVTAGV